MGKEGEEMGKRGEEGTRDAEVCEKRQGVSGRRDGKALGYAAACAMERNKKVTERVLLLSSKRIEIEGKSAKACQREMGDG